MYSEYQYIAYYNLYTWYAILILCIYIPLHPFKDTTAFLDKLQYNFTSRENDFGIGYQSFKITFEKCKRLSILIFCRVYNKYYCIRIYISQRNGCGMARKLFSDYFLNTLRSKILPIRRYCWYIKLSQLFI